MGNDGFHAWQSPLTARQLAVAGVRLSEPRYDGDDLYWLEARPAEQGRVALVRERFGVVAEVAPELSVRTRVHEYGGGAWDARDGVVVVSADPSGQVLRLDGAESGAFTALTPAGRGWRFADLRVVPSLGLVLAVREDHSVPGEAVNTLVALRLNGLNDDGGVVLAGGADFYACPELSAGGQLAWMQWTHPSMPWDSCFVMTGKLDAESQAVSGVEVVAGDAAESAVHPMWRGEELLFCSDRSGFWELYADGGRDQSGDVGRNASGGDATRDHSAGEAGRDHSAGEARRHQSVGEASRNQSAGEAGRHPSAGEAGRDPSAGEAGRDPSAGEAGRDPSDGEAGRDPSDGEAGRDQSDGEAGRDQSDGRARRDPLPLTALGADLVEPFWVFGRRPYALTGAGDVVIRPRIDGRSQPMLLRAGEYLGLTTEVVDCDSLDACGDRIVLLAQFADVPTEIIELRPGHRRAVRAAAPRVLAPEWVSHAEPVTWPGEAGEVHGWFYEPTNPLVERVETPARPPSEPAETKDGRAADGVSTRSTDGAPARPPLIVISHGGPTAFSSSGFDLGVQFWTTRGFAVLDVNYSGSTGYGRAYRDRLQGQWGVLDVADCIAGARSLADAGRVDGDRLVIRGGSAGGYTTLRALTTSTAFAAGCSRYGIGDLAALASDTHKFESRYLDGLVGPWPAASEVYAERSPINHVDALNCPMLILQGADDAVVPLNQARTMADAVRAKGLEAELIVFEGEGHGFRRAETVQRALEAELAFYQRVLID